MNTIKLYKKEELTTEIKILDGKSAIKFLSLTDFTKGVIE